MILIMIHTQIECFLMCLENAAEDLKQKKRRVLLLALLC